MQNPELKVFTIDSPIDNSLFEEFYHLMKLSFPKNERRSKKEFKSLCQNCPYYKIYALLNKKSLAAFLTVWEFEDFTFGDHFAVSPALRGCGIGSSLLSQIKDKSRHPLIIEVELPENNIAKRRIEFYRRNSLVLCDFDYLLPPMQKGCSALPMKIMAYPAAPSDEKFKAYKEKIYKEVYGI